MDYAGGEGVSVYAEAKGEYTRQLCQYLSPALQKYFLDLLSTAKEREADPKKHLLTFQTLLEGISEWNIDKVQRETQSLAMSTQCDYLEELLTAVFIAHTKVLSAIRLTNRQKKLQITIPKLEHFLHRTLTECARLLWTNTFLFASTGSSLERQKNMRQIEGLIGEGILQGVRTMLPVKSILREYLSNDETDEEEEDEEDNSTVEPAVEPAVEHAVEPAIEPTIEPAVEPAVEPSTTGPTGSTEEPPVIDLDDRPQLDFNSPGELFKEVAKGIEAPDEKEMGPGLEEADLPLEDEPILEEPPAEVIPGSSSMDDAFEFEELT